MADSATATPPSNSGSKPPCPFLDKLSDELRNMLASSMATPVPTSASGPKPQCSFLDKLPSEMRNMLASSMPDSSTATLPSNSGSKGPCMFLDKLPGELRNDIYELVYSSDHEPDAPVNLLNAKPPQRKALLVTGRQVYKEAKEIYLEAYRKQWKEAKFLIRKEQLCDEKYLWAEMSKFSPADLDNIKHLTINFDLAFAVVSKYVMEDSVSRYESQEDANDNVDTDWIGWIPWADGHIRLVVKPDKKGIETEIHSRTSKVPLHLQLIDLVGICSEIPERIESEVSIESLYRRWGRLQDYCG